MTDEAIKREKTFNEELPYFKERIKEVFDYYHNPNGSEDSLEIDVLRDSKRIVRKAEEEIVRQQAEIDDLTERLDATIVGQETLQKALAEKDREVEHLNKEVDRLSQCVLYHDGHSEDAKSEAIIEFAQRLKSLVNQHHYMLANIHNSRDFGMFTVGFEQAIDNIVKEMVGDNNA